MGFVHGSLSAKAVELLRADTARLLLLDPTRQFLAETDALHMNAYGAHTRKHARTHAREEQSSGDQTTASAACAA